MFYTQNITKKTWSILEPSMFKCTSTCTAKALLTYKTFLFFTVVFFLWSTSSAKPNPDYLSHQNRPCIVREKYCGAYVVWHTLRYYGLSKPIDNIVDKMQIENKSSVSIYEIIQEFKTDGIFACAVKLNLNKASAIDKPFIPYIAPAKGENFGHFVLCLPTQTGHFVKIDGTGEPMVYELALLKNGNNELWDGTAILIDGIRKNPLYYIYFSKTIAFFLIGLLALLCFGYLWKSSKPIRTHRKRREEELPMG